MAPTGSTRSVEARKQYERERKRKYRQNMTDLAKERQKEQYKKYNATRKKKADLSQRDLRRRNKLTRERVRKCRQRKSAQSAMSNLETVEQVSDPVPGPSRQKIAGRKRKSAKLSKLLRENLRLKKQLYEAQRTVSSLKKKEYRRNISEIKTPDKILNKILPNEVKKTLPIKARKKIVYNEVVVSHIESAVLMGTKRKERVELYDEISPKLKKYKLLKYHDKFHRNNLRRIKYTARRVIRNRDKVAEAIKSFFQDDSNTRMTAGKKETITRKKQKVQKRYITDSLKNLHKKFNRETETKKVSYATFRRMRPFWVCFPKVEDRDSCACTVHANFKNLVSALWKKKMLLTSNLTDILKEASCDTHDQNCMYRNCSKCVNKLTITVPPDQATDKVKYHQWVRVKETITVRGVMKEIQKVDKVERTMSAIKLTGLFFEALDVFKVHSYNIKHQFKAIKKIKDIMKQNEVLFHIDFSENYALKYGEEIQSMHFGASRQQIALHTGLMYQKDTDDGPLIARPFATLSTNLDHGAHAVIAHMKPIFLHMTKKDVSFIHILSDSPSAQYRNRFTLHFMKNQLKKSFSNLQAWVWNYSISGHGKGAADGVGAVLKRTADRVVALGGDIPNIEELCKVFQTSCPGVQVFLVPDEDIKQAKEELQKIEAPPLKGIMAVQQVICHPHSSCFTMNSLSSYPIYFPVETNKTSSLECSPNEGHGDDFKIGDFVSSKQLGYTACAYESAM